MTIADEKFKKVLEKYSDLFLITKRYKELDFELVNESDAPLNYDDMVKHMFTVKDYKRIKKNNETVILLVPQDYKIMGMYNAKILNEQFDLDNHIENKTLKDNQSIFKDIYIKINSTTEKKIRKFIEKQNKEADKYMKEMLKVFAPKTFKNLKMKQKSETDTTKAKAKAKATKKISSAPCPQTYVRNEKGNCVVTMSTPCKDKNKRRNIVTKRCRKEKI